MPNRIIKESICTSSDIDGLSWFEEVFFYRLITQCDDFGRMDARPAILRSRIFPLKDVTNKHVEAALSKLAIAGMVRVYEYDRQPFLQLENWGKHQRLRDARGKYPAPTENADCGSSPQLAATCREPPPESESNPNPNPKILCTPREVAKAAIAHLNHSANKKYTLTDSYMTHINARITENATLDDFKNVIDIKVSEWGDPPQPGKEDMRKFIRPETLFGTKFWGYLNQEPPARRNQQNDLLMRGVAGG